MTRSRWAVGVAAVVVAIALDASAASAKSPCGKEDSCVRLIQKVRVSHKTATGATLEAWLNGEKLEVQFVLEKLTEPAEEEVLSTGYFGPGLMHWAGYEGNYLSPDTRYAFWVRATQDGHQETSKHVKFKTQK